MDRIVLHQGWFQDTLPEQAPDQIALLRLDGDLYDSTFVCLNALYPKIASGGAVTADDYILVGCRQAIIDYFDGQEPPGIAEIADSNGEHFWLKP
jgi:Macrocin-O-methyltransferase (TylF).